MNPPNPGISPRPCKHAQILLSALVEKLHLQPSFGQVTANGNQRIWALIEDVGVRGKFGEGRNAVYSIRTGLGGDHPGLLTSP